MTKYLYTTELKEKLSIDQLCSAAGAGVALEIVVPAEASVEILDDVMTHEAVTLSLFIGSGAVVTFKSILVVQSGEILRSVTARCEGAGARATLFFTCQTSGSGKLVLDTIQHHEASHTQSNVCIRGVSEDNSRATVSSTIYIAPQIAGIVADQVHKHLILEQGARVVSVPALDILSDDVSCSHGSAITHLDAGQMFYLHARGYDQKMARDAVVKAFLVI